MNSKVKVLVMNGVTSGRRTVDMQRFAGSFVIKPFKAEALLESGDALPHPMNPPPN